jgi:hypothetical protein
MDHAFMSGLVNCIVSIVAHISWLKLSHFEKTVGRVSSPTISRIRYNYIALV